MRRMTQSCRVVALMLGVMLLAPALPALAKSSPKKSGPKVITPEDVARLRVVRGAWVSPDGRFVAYLRGVPRKPGSRSDGSAWRELWVLTREGKQRGFVRGKVKVRGVQWRPDGRAISFVAKRFGDKKPALWSIPIDGGEAQRVLRFGGGIGAYAWEPDSRHVVFIGQPPKSKALRKLSSRGFKQEIVEEQMRPSKLYRARVAELDHPHGKVQPIAIDGSVSHPRVSPDGQLVAVGVAPDPRIDSYYMRRKIRIIDLKSGKAVGELNREGKLGDWQWSPDSKHLGVIAAADPNDPSAGRLLLVDRAGKLVRELLPNYPGHVTSLAWKGAKTVGYIGAKGVMTEVGEVSLGGKVKVRIAPGGPILSRLTISANGKTAVATASSPKHPSEVVLVNLEKGQTVRLTDVNPWLKHRKLAKQEPITWKARDGKTIGGVLVHPLVKPKGRAPLILTVHGGPESHVPNGWVTWYAGPGQMAAAKGYYVLYPNYRGSTGRGVAFSKLDQADYAGAEFNDLVDAITHLDKAGLVDPKKVGITGGSYGGFASAWAATKLTKHFAASVMFVGISDQISKFGTTDIPWEMYMVHARKWPWKDWSWFRERSPVTYVEQARTPILILHGKNDPRVHPSQSMTLYRYLKTIGKVPVRLVLYPGEGHGNAKASARYDYSLRMLRWMDHYLTGPGGKAPAHALSYDKVMGRRGKDGKRAGRRGGDMHDHKSKRRSKRRRRRR
ncbi:MAG: S9 family peptidase [Myxococcales bacterium]|nr:S9 family peptidase [Myxococcales bacterium]